MFETVLLVSLASFQFIDIGHFVNSMTGLWEGGRGGRGGGGSEPGREIPYSGGHNTNFPPLDL